MLRPSLHQKVQIPILNLGSHGEGVGRFDHFTLFVEGALPGEWVEVEITQLQKKFGRARLLQILTPSSNRVSPVCPLFGRCGGCQLMHLSYEEQLVAKRQRVVDAFRRIGSIKEIEITSCHPSPHPLAYRNKIQLPVRQGKKGLILGLYAAGSHDLIEIEACNIHCPLGEKIFKIIQPLIQNSSVQAYDPSNGEGELRHVLIKSSVKHPEALVVFVTNGPSSPELNKIAKTAMEQCGEIKGIINNIHCERDNVILGSEYRIIEGHSFITETLCDLKFNISAASFFQVNPHQAENLYRKTLELAALEGSEHVLDAYCGVGTLSLLFAKHCLTVTGIECVPEAISNAKENARLNQIKNVNFVCADSGAYVRRLENIDVALVNPPRKGCEEAFLNGIRKLAPQKLIYVSCDPATLARDSAILLSYGYDLKSVFPFDMFPQTAHVESVAYFQQA